MRDMSEAQRLAAIKWAAEARIRLDVLRSVRFGKLRDQLIIESINDCQSEKLDMKRGE